MSTRFEIREPDLAIPDESAFATLSGELFPGTYYSAERILAMRQDGYRVLAAAEGGIILGFAVTSVDPGGANGEVHFLGVREDARGKGLGRRLLDSAVGSLLAVPGVEDMVLNVSGVNVEARGLYERSGFRLRCAGLPLRRRSVEG